MKIGFLDVMKWDYNIETAYQKPLGGSQSALCYLAEALTKLGHQVFLFNKTSQSGMSRGVLCLERKINLFNREIWRSLDFLIILNVAGRGRSVKPLINSKTRLIFWGQQADDCDQVQSLQNPDERNLYDAFIFVSAWQKQQYCQRFNLDKKRCYIMKNAVSPSFLNLFPQQSILAQKIAPPILAYTSTPYRGLDILLSVFSTIRQAIPGTRLKVFSSLKVYHFDDQNDRDKFGHIYDICQQIPGVEYIGSIPQAKLAQELKSVTLLAYPNTFRETSCIAVMEAMASGCQIVTSNLAALPETTAGRANLIEVTDIENFATENLYYVADYPDWKTYKYRFAQTVIDVLEKSLNAKKDPGARESQEKFLREQVNYANQCYNWGDRSQEWEKLLLNMMTNQSDLWQLESDHPPAQATVEEESYGLQPDNFNLQTNLQTALGATNYVLSENNQSDNNQLSTINDRLLTIHSEANQNSLIESYKNQAELCLAQGHLTQAIEFCYAALKIRPDFSSAYMILGNTLHAQGKIPAAIRAYQHILKLHPEYAEVYANIGSMYVKLNNLDAAITYYQKALEIKPNLGGIYWNLGRIYQIQQKVEPALIALQRALELEPSLGNAQTSFEIGNKLMRIGQAANAIKSYQKAITMQPTWAEAYANIGIAYSQTGEFSQAKQCYEKAIALKPDLIGLYYNLASLCVQNGKLKEAIEAYKMTIEKQPELVEAHANLGNVYSVLGQLPEAIACYEKAISLKPEFAEVYCRLGHLQKQDQPQAAIKNFEKAIELKPEFFEAHQQLCDLLSHSNNLSAAIKASNRYYELCGEKVPVLAATAYVFAYLQAGMYQEALVKVREIEQLCHQTQCLNFNRMELKLLYEIFLFSLSHLRDEPEANAKFHQVVAQQYYKTGIKPQRLPKKTHSRSLKIGFLSKHFRRHSVGWCSEAVIKELTKITPDIHLYVTGPIKTDEMTKKFETMVGKFYWPKSFPNGFASGSELVKEIQQDDLDILIDLDSTTVPVNIEILQHYPAQRCLTWLGFDAPYISPEHYFLCDWFSHPPGSEKHYTEQLIRLSHGSVALHPLESRPIDRNAVRKLFGIRPDQLAYLCVAPGRKSNSDMVRSQIRILAQVPDSVLIRKGQGDPEIIHQLYRKECELQGVNFDRIKFLGSTRTEEEHRSVYHLGDIVLDSYPYNGGTHNLEALSANIPLITRTGGQYLSRMGYSFLKSANLDIGVAWTWDEYVELGIKFGFDSNLRQQIREHLIRSKQPESLAPLWNPARLAQEMYEVFRQML